MRENTHLLGFVCLFDQMLFKKMGSLEIHTTTNYISFLMKSFNFPCNCLELNCICKTYDLEEDQILFLRNQFHRAIRGG